MGNAKSRLEKRHLQQETVTGSTRLDEKVLKELIDKGVQKHPEMIEENTSMSSFSLETSNFESSFTNMLSNLGEQDVVSLTDLMLSTDDETFLGILMDNQAFKAVECYATGDLQHHLSQLLIELEANALDKVISCRGDRKKAGKRFMFSETSRDVPKAKRRRFNIAGIHCK